MLGQRAAAPTGHPAFGRPSRCPRVCRAAAPGPGAGGGDGGAPRAAGGPALSEDMLARLRAAEEEAARLKQQLADIQSTQVGAGQAVAARAPKASPGACRRPGPTPLSRVPAAQPACSPAAKPSAGAPSLLPQPAAAAPGKAVLGAKPQRIDGTDKRETLDALFNASAARRNSWLSEGAAPRRGAMAAMAMAAMAAGARRY